MATPRLAANCSASAFRGTPVTPAVPPAAAAAYALQAAPPSGLHPSSNSPCAITPGTLFDNLENVIIADDSSGAVCENDFLQVMKEASKTGSLSGDVALLDHEGENWSTPVASEKAGESFLTPCTAHVADGPTVGDASGRQLLLRRGGEESDRDSSVPVISDATKKHLSRWNTAGATTPPSLQADKTKSISPVSGGSSWKGYVLPDGKLDASLLDSLVRAPASAPRIFRFRAGSGEAASPRKQKTQGAAEAQNVGGAR